VDSPNTIYHVRKNAIARLASSSPTPALDADLLLCHVLGRDRPYLFAHPEHLLTDAEYTAFQHLVARASDGEPIAYLLGHRGFFDLDLIVTPAVLIPRPETELLLEAALAFAPVNQPVSAADIGTGSGALAVTFAKHRPLAHVHAVDVSGNALAVAQQNAEKYAVSGRITWHHGSLLEPLIAQSVRLDLLMANLPYIPRDVVQELDVSRHEPMLALDGGIDGLDLIRELLGQMRGVLRPGGLALLEFGAGQGADVLAAARERFGDDLAAHIIYDYAGHDRHLHMLMP
jgi:release factor glutamine methyltransferase